ncbi:alpha/beta fold hydrolase [Goodfellowiella coeruleoviolacea]|uniref:Pimeloyl-ACP methyl ester carboxylesterase n=1 Tax=Goodfellowiella coeruleoviolacea TaxID=334858 RepID=A0AAE3GGF4_9PSEU|nr:alpha/beta hydrolase [Goodfellowiella coeruleoviolacea]MCP2166844.1 Pimeloyl-ACP methyl ester carboxylesterase [Goodfellowiella coeruleoviolacea]
MDTPRTATLRVPGAHLHHEVRGTGPVLLLIPGGSGDGGQFSAVADALADRFTVVTYDRRGYSRSPLHGPVHDDQRLAEDREDVHRLLTHLTHQPAHVFGSSSGAVVALDFLARHPTQIATAVVHEPPVVTLLPDVTDLLNLLDEVHHTYRRSGVDQALRQFTGAIGLDVPSVDEARLPAPLAEVRQRVRGNLPFWLEHELRQYPRAVPDVDALHAWRNRLVLAVGQDSREQFPHRATTALADRLGVPSVAFPGGHLGFATRAPEFAERLATVLGRG